MIGLEQLPRAYLWRYSLHPGLWSLHALEKLLTKLESGAATMDARTPWAFERIGARKESQSDGDAVTQCYRVTSPVITAFILSDAMNLLKDSSSLRLAMQPTKVASDCSLSKSAGGMLHVG